MPEPTTTGRIPFRTYETWYAMYGNLASSEHLPLIVLHGGPGAGHDYLQSVGELHARTGVPVVMYDQVGCGKSSHLKDAPPGTIGIPFYLDELDSLLNALNIKRYDLLGQSWGGILALEHAVRQPPGLRRLIIEGTAASVPLGDECRRRCYEGYPKNLRDALYQFDEDHLDTPDYQDAKVHFRKTNQCRLDPMPEEMIASWKNIAEDPTVLLTLYGPSMIRTTGILKDWTILDRLHLIKNEAFVIHGKYDWCGQEAAEPFRSADWNVKMVTLETAGHMAHLDEKENFFRHVIEFLTA